MSVALRSISRWFGPGVVQNPFTLELTIVNRQSFKNEKKENYLSSKRNSRYMCVYIFISVLSALGFGECNAFGMEHGVNWGA